jgi:GDP/UDP-N,N'-diacetylbacillosamine 2-epimerase (hydrolysing)
MKRRVCYVTGTRADFGLMESTLRQISVHPKLSLELCVTGMHLKRQYGLTVREIERTGLKIAARIPVKLCGSDGSEMACALAGTLRGLVTVFQRIRPDVVLVLGDRGEMLAAAIAAVHLNIHVVHIHGGERSGTIDESIRHAISKLAHFHLTATAGARARLIKMGERPEHVRCTGAPGLDGIRTVAKRSRPALCSEHSLDPDRPVALVVYHPVVQDAALEGERMGILLEGVLATGAQVLCLLPNSDAGGAAIRETIGSSNWRKGMRVVTHFPRADYVSWLAAADVLVGNSSSGIIEAASFGLPVINVGDRQVGRERSANVVDVPIDEGSIRRATLVALRAGRSRIRNVYGDGRAGKRIVESLTRLPLTHDLLKKRNAY